MKTLLELQRATEINSKIYHSLEWSISRKSNKHEPKNIWTKMDNNKTRYYNTLNIDPTATREEIAAAYRQLAL